MNSNHDSTKNAAQSNRNNWLGKYPGKTLKRLGALLGGLWLTTNILRILWPEADQISSKSYLINQINKIKLPESAVSILLLEKKYQNYNSSNLEEDFNRFKPIQSINLILVNNRKPSEVINIPIELPILLPNNENIKTIGNIFKIGGLALMNDLITNILTIPKETPKRYIIGTNESIKYFKEHLLIFDYKNISNINKSILSSTILSSEDIEIDLEKKKPIYILNKALLPITSSENNHQKIIALDKKKRMSIKSFTKKIMKGIETNMTYKELISVNAILLKDNKSKMIGELNIKP